MKKALLGAIVALLVLPGSGHSQCTLNPPLSLGVDTSGCAGASITLNAGAGYVSYLWSNGSAAQTITVTVTGVYWIRVTDGFGCIGEDSINVSITTNLNVTLGADIDTCNGALVILDAGAGPYVYQWQDGSTDQQLAVTTTGTYSVSITDQNSCDASDTIVVTFHPFPTVSVSADQNMFCAGDSAILMADSGHAAYDWSNGATTQSTAVTATGNYSCTVTSAFGCATVSSGIGITVWPQPAQPVVVGDKEELTSTAGDNYWWYVDSVLSDTSNSRTIIPAVPGMYQVQIISDDGCMSLLSDAFEVVLGVEETDIPQFISPNGDGINDIFRIANLEDLADNILIIINRWGNEVFRAEPYTNNWMGTNENGSDLPAGTYYYILDQKDGSEPYSGYFEITR